MYSNAFRDLDGIGIPTTYDRIHTLTLTLWEADTYPLRKYMRIIQQNTLGYVPFFVSCYIHAHACAFGVSGSQERGSNPIKVAPLAKKVLRCEDERNLPTNRALVCPLAVWALFRLAEPLNALVASQESSTSLGSP